jgi:hypothetical protein
MAAQREFCHHREGRETPPTGAVLGVEDCGHIYMSIAYCRLILEKYGIGFAQSRKILAQDS